MSVPHITQHARRQIAVCDGASTAARSCGVSYRALSTTPRLKSRTFSAAPTSGSKAAKVSTGHRVASVWWHSLGQYRSSRGEECVVPYASLILHIA
eukprot:3271328-Rhodomonas_salina.1